MSDTPDVDTYIKNQTDLHPNGGISEFIKGIARERNEAIKQRDKLAEKCRLLLDSPSVQKSWPMDGTKRATKPSETHSSATATVKFRHLLGIHAAIEKMKGGKP